jgi:hypothetical protein
MELIPKRHLEGPCRCVFIVLLWWSLHVAADAGSDMRKVEALMPDFPVEHEEAYLCTAVPLPEIPLKLVGIEPLSTEEVVHHMLLFGASP